MEPDLNDASRMLTIISSFGFIFMFPRFLPPSLLIPLSFFVKIISCVFFAFINFAVCERTFSYAEVASSESW